MNNNGVTIIHKAATQFNSQIFKMLLERDDVDVSIKDNNGNSVIHYASHYGMTNNVEVLLELGIAIDDDINNYTPYEVRGAYVDEDEIIPKYNDCRHLIFAEVEHRRKRILFDTFINHYIDYRPHINNIYTRCYPTGNLKVAKPSIGWSTAEAIRDKYYFDEVFFYLHMGIANFYTNIEPNAIATTSSRNSITHAANNSNTTSTLMKLLTDRLCILLKPDQNLSIEVPYFQKN